MSVHAPPLTLPHALPGPVLNVYLPRPRNKTGVNLLSTEGEQRAAREQAAAEAGRPREIISLLKPNVTIALVDDATVYPAEKVPEHVRTREVFSGIYGVPLRW
jgi:hypothetical protein